MRLLFGKDTDPPMHRTIGDGATTPEYVTESRPLSCPGRRLSECSLVCVFVRVLWHSLGIVAAAAAVLLVVGVVCCAVVAAVAVAVVVVSGGSPPPNLTLSQVSASLSASRMKEKRSSFLNLALSTI